MAVNDFDALPDEDAATLYYLRHPNMGPAMRRDGFPQEMVNAGAVRYAEDAVKLPDVMKQIRAWLNGEDQ